MANAFLFIEETMRRGMLNFALLMALIKAAVFAKGIPDP